ncbi:MAG: WecB/TagA/CpsF family glycosyltransferase [Microbacterium chocolatum]|nr:WecB/TagA/CpsF family glycosyltransferase [Microbacterium chocolatum]
MPQPFTEKFAELEVRYVGGIPFVVSTLNDAVEWLISFAAPKGLGVNVRLANAYNVALASSDPNYAQLLKESGMNFPDGTPVAWFMNRRHHGQAEAGRVRGPSFFVRALERSQNTGTNHFLLGGSPAVLELLHKTLTERYPGSHVAGTYSPPFREVDESYIEDCAREVIAAGAHIVWVGLGTPKQDVVGTHLAEQLGITTVNVGAAFDFVAGTAPEAPKWLQDSGFEWVFRLLTEPRRLWRRYLLGNISFLRTALRRSPTTRTSLRFDAQAREYRISKQRKEPGAA